MDAGKVYVADTNNHRIRLLESGKVTTFAGGAAGFADGPAASAQFKSPSGVAVDGAGKLYIADSADHRVRVIDNGLVSTLAGTGVAGLTDGPAASAQFNGPSDVAVDATNKVYVADRANHCIRLIENGQVKTLAGTTVAGFADGLAASAQFNYPTGIAVDASGRVYVADQSNHAVRVIENGKVTTIGTGAAGFADGPASSAAFNQPTSVAVDGDGYLYVADYGNHRIRVIDPF